MSAVHPSRPLLWARALGSLAALLVLLVGAPWVLLRAGTLPAGVPSATEVGQTLTAPDDGSVLVRVITLLCWALWIYFAASLVLEAAAMLRRVRAPRVRGFASGQRLAGVLLGGLLFLPTANAIAATPATAAVATAHSPTATPGDTTAPQTQAPTTATPEATGLVHVVTPTGETVWDLAEQYLGDGRRHSDIRALNPNLPSGSVLSEGTRVQLPHDARTAPQDGLTTTTADVVSASALGINSGPDSALSSAREYTVEAGDSLWSIADTYGDPTEWRGIYEANKGEPQPGGGTFDNPNLILPGQELDLPQATGPADPPTAPGKNTSPPADDRVPEQTPDAESPAPDKAPDAQENEHQDEGQPAPPATNAPTPPASPTATPAPHSTGDPSKASEPSASPKATDSPSPAAEEQATAGMQAGMIGLASTGVLAAGILGTVAYRRVMQQRRRRPGRRIAMPSGQTARTEEVLRSSDASIELSLLDAALRTAALHLSDDGRPLPDVAAIQLGEQGVRIHLSQSVPPTAPFTADPGQSAQWWCPAGSNELLSEEAIRDVDAPYPGLVALGSDEDGAIVLVDLEHVGALHLTGAARVEVLRTLAVTLALSPLAGQIELVVAGEDTAPGLSMLDGDRVTPYADLGGAVQALERHHTEQKLALGALGELGTLAQARPSQDMGELWPLVVVADLDTCPAEPDVADGLWDLLEQRVQSAMAIITSSTGARDTDGVWTVDTDAPYVTVPGTQVRVILSACSEQEYADILELALIADSPTDVAGSDTVASVPHPAPQPDSPTPSEAPPTRPAPSTGSAPAGATPGPLAALADLEDEEEDDPEETEGKVQPPAAGTSPSSIVLPAVAPAPRVSARLPLGSEAEARVPNQATSASGAPTVCVLGPVDLNGAQGTITSNRRTLSLEMTAWLTLRPGATNHQIDEILAPGGRVTRDTRNSRIGDVRRWLGSDTEGNRYLPHVSTQPDKLYRLAGVECDWHQFQGLVHESRTVDGTAAEQLLRQALELVRGRPFAGIPPRRYVWAEPLVQDMIAAIVDVADDLASRYLEHGDGRGALWAATHGLDAAREVESLWRHKFRALALLGEESELEAAIRQLESLLLDLGSSMSEETGQTLRLLQAARH